MSIKIEKGVDKPTKSASGYKYPISALEVNDSFFVPGKTRSSIASAVINQKAKEENKNKDFEYFNVVENDIKGVRVFRTK